MVVYEFCCSRLKRTCLAALKEQQRSQLNTWAPIKNRLSPQAAPWPLYSQRVTWQETDQTDIWPTSFWDKDSRRRNCSAAASGDPQASRAWSGPQQSYSRGARLLEGKLRKRNNFIINNLDVPSETQSKNQQLHRQQVIKSTKIRRNQQKKEKNNRN